MNGKYLKIFCAVTLTALIVSEVSITFAKDIEFLNIPYWVYISSVYLRAMASISCLFLGLYSVVARIKFGYLYVFIGVLSVFLSIVPPITALYFSKDIDTSLLSGSELRYFNDSMSLQKSYLLFFASIFIACTAVFCVAIKKRKITT